MKNYIHNSKYFYGQTISNDEIENGYMSYRTLANALHGCILNNEIYSKAFNFGEWELVNGYDYDEETEEYYDIYQWYIISGYGAEILQDCTNEIVYYHEELDIYLWAITHWGTSWDYVFTDIQIDLNNTQY